MVMRSSLKGQPNFDGQTSYCNKSFNLVNQGNPAHLEKVLQQISRNGPMLGTKSFGRRKSISKKGSKKGRSKRGSKRVNKRKSKRRSRFGSFPFQEGKLSTSSESIGLPLGAKSPSSIYDTFPNILRQGQALPQPYGPVDNLRMQSLFDIHGFGRRSRCKRCGRKSKSKHRHKKEKRKSLKRGYGNATPGTAQWKAEATPRNELSRHMNKYANEGQLKEARGWSPSTVQLYMNNSSSNVPNLIGNTNVPAQFTNNQMNSPVFKFGTKKGKGKGKGKEKGNKQIMCLRSPPKLKESENMLVKRKFGQPLSNIAGPNVVGYESPIPLYHAGSNTINFMNNKMFNPDIIPAVGKVQQDGMTPKAWLTQSVGVGDGLGNRFRFGSGVYTPDGAVYGSGRNVIMQPKPHYMDKSNKVTGSFLKGFGKNKNAKKSLSSHFGGSVITLNTNGQIKLSKA